MTVRAIVILTANVVAAMDDRWQSAGIEDILVRKTYKEQYVART